MARPPSHRERTADRVRRPQQGVQLTPPRPCGVPGAEALERLFAIARCAGLRASDWLK